jgi:hypothetical protein
MKIIIHPQVNAGSPTPVHLNINGVAVDLPVGQEIDVTDEQFVALGHSDHTIEITVEGEAAADAIEQAPAPADRPVVMRAVAALLGTPPPIFQAKRRPRPTPSSPRRPQTRRPPLPRKPRRCDPRPVAGGADAAARKVERGRSA